MNGNWPVKGGICSFAKRSEYEVTELGAYEMAHAHLTKKCMRLVSKAG